MLAELRTVVPGVDDMSPIVLTNGGVDREAPASPKRKPTQHKPKSRGNGDGSIYQRANGMWCAAIKDENGQRKYLYSKERAVVSRRLIEAMNNLHLGLPVTQKRLTVGAWLDYWLENIVRREREPTTYEGYEVSVRCHIKPFLGTKFLRKLQVEDVERWLRMLEKRRARCTYAPIRAH